MNQDEAEYWYGDAIDKLVSASLARLHQPVGRFEPRKTHRLYDGARKKFGEPLTMMAAHMIKENVKKGSNVIIVTNSYEMDGPPGAAALARSLDIALEAKSMIVTCTSSSAGVPDESRSARILPETCCAVGMMPVSYDKLRDRPHRVVIEQFPTSDMASSEKNANAIIEKYSPAIVISEEANGRNRKNVYHTGWGYGHDPDPSVPRQRIDHMLEAAVSKRIPTIALGDNGNEAGFGAIEEIVRKYHPYGNKCQCPCGSGITAVTKADLVLPVSISNWGCYGIEACLAIITGIPDAMHGRELQRAMLYACAQTGCPDGVTSFTTPTEDGTPHNASLSVADLLKMTADQSLKRFKREW